MNKVRILAQGSVMAFGLHFAGLPFTQDTHVVRGGKK